MGRITSHAAIVTIAVLVLALVAFGAPKFIHYNGFLMQGGVPASTGDYKLTFRIYDTEEIGAPPLWTEVQDPVAVKDGKFHVQLGSVTELTKEVFSADDRWLGIEIGSDGEMTGRTPIGSVPYAFMAGSVADRAIDSAKIALKSIKHENIKDEAIDSLKIAQKSIKKENIKDRAIDSLKIAEKSIKHENIKDEAIDSLKIAQKSIKKENIKDRAIDSLKIAMKSIKHENIKDEAIDSLKIAQGSIKKENIKDGAITTEKIENGTIDFEDIAPNGATTAGVVMKWDGDSWELGEDVGGGGTEGWVDDGTVVRLETGTDSVGIGTATPTEKLDVVGRIHASGSISSGNSITIDGDGDKITASSGTIDFAEGNLHTTGRIRCGDASEWIGINGVDNKIEGESTTGSDLVITSSSGNVGFGDDNLVTTGSASIGPGHTNEGDASFVAGSGNSALSDFCVVSGGYGNQAGHPDDGVGDYATVGGGFQNTARADYSTIVGGYGNSISQNATRSYLFGMNSSLTRNNTFMVDMPHIWFGDELSGYEFPGGRGAEGQVLTLQAAGQLAWQDPSLGLEDYYFALSDFDATTIDTATSGELQLTSTYADGSAYDVRFVNEQSGSVTGVLIADEGVDAQEIKPSSKFRFAGVYLADSTVADSALLSKGTLDDNYFALSDFDDASIDTSASGQLRVKAGGVTTSEIADGTISFADIGDNSAGSGQVMKYNGSIWSNADDETGGWVDDGSSIRLESSSDDVGIGTASPAARLHVENVLLTSSEAAVEVDFGTSTADIGTKGVTVESATLTIKGSQVAVSGVSSVDRGVYGQGTATGRLGQSATWTAYDQFIGVYGNSNASTMANMGSSTSSSLGGRFTAQPASAMTLDATGTYYVGGVYGEVSGEINADPNGIIGGVIGVDNSTGTGTSFAGYFAGDVYASGDVGVGTTSPSYELDVNGDIGCVALHESSDGRLKTSVSQLTDVLAGIEKIRGVSFTWNEQARLVGAVPGERQIGVIAQELETVFPELVSSPENGYKSVDYAKLTAVLIEAVKEQQKTIEELTTKVAETDELRAQINHLKVLVETVLAQNGAPGVSSDELAVNR